MTKYPSKNIWTRLRVPRISKPKTNSRTRAAAWENNAMPNCQCRLLGGKPVGAPYRGCANHQFNWWFWFEVNEKNWYNLSLLSRALHFDFPSVYQLFDDLRLSNDSYFWACQNNYHIWYKITLINGKIDRKWGFKSCHYLLKIQCYFDTMQRYQTERCNYWDYQSNQKGAYPSSIVSISPLNKAFILSRSNQR